MLKRSVVLTRVDIPREHVGSGTTHVILHWIDRLLANIRVRVGVSAH